MNFDEKLVEIVDKLKDLEKSPLIAYKEKLANLQNWNRSTTFVETRKFVIVARFENYRKLMTKCRHCYLFVYEWNCEKSFKKHFQKTFDCSLVLQLETTKLEISEIIKQIELIEQEAQKKVAKRAEIETIEIAKSTSNFSNIDIFDSTFVCDILKFDLYSKMMKFLQHFQQIQHQYRKSNVLDLLSKCVRNSVFAWFNNQSSFIIIQKFDRDLACAFSIISLESIAKSSIFITNFSSQYHSCVECFAQFFSLSRLLKHIKQKNVCFKVVCKQCEQNFNFKNKFHEHIREHHISKSITSFISSITSKDSNFRVFTSEFMYKIKEKSTIICSFVSFVSFTFFATSRSQIFYFATSTSIFESISSKCSNFSIATLNITSKSMKKLSVNSFTFSTSSSRTFVSKFYFIVDDLIRMFREKFKSFDLHSHQKSRSFSRNSDIFYQSRIIVYFMFAVNQKTSINQISKSSKSKISKQYMFAKSIRFAFALSKKSIFSSYKMTNIFYISLQSKFSSKFSFAWFQFTFTFSFAFSLTFSSFFRSRISDHVCCICFDNFNFRNDSFSYRRSSQLYFSNRRSMKKMKEMISRFETKLKENEK